MCGGGGFLGTGIGPDISFSDVKRGLGDLPETLSNGGIVPNESKNKAKSAAKDAARKAAKNIANARKAELDAYNADVIDQKRRRKAGSVLARAGSGLTDTANSVLAAAASSGKTTTGA